MKDDILPSCYTSELNGTHVDLNSGFKIKHREQVLQICMQHGKEEKKQFS